MINNNKKRLLSLLEILKQYTDAEHKLSIYQLIEKLQEEDISINNRKTLYDDFKNLEEANYCVEYQDGYYLSEAPFSLAEIKIIVDSLNSLKNLDDKFLNKLKDKLYSFISIYEREFLKNLEYRNRHSDQKFIYRLQDCLSAINFKQSLIIKRNNKNTNEEIVPLFIHRDNDMYYLYYHYLNSDKLYHTRFDNLAKIELSNKTDNIHISKSAILEHIAASSNSFITGKPELINFLICKDNEYLRNRLSDDFPNIIFTKDGFSIKSSVNDAFFCKLTNYGDQILIKDQKIKKAYLAFLNKIITHNKQE